MTFFNDEFEAKVCIANMLCDVTFGQAEALTIACDRWDKFDKIKEVLSVETNEVYDEIVKLKNEIQKEDKKCLTKLLSWGGLRLPRN